MPHYMNLQASVDAFLVWKAKCTDSLIEVFTVP